MDNNEATSTVMSRIQRLDPENACKIMGYILIQDPGEQEMIRLAFGPETHLISLINQAKVHLGLSSNSLSAPTTPSSPSPFNPLSNPNRPNPFPQSSPRIIIPNNGFHLNPSSPSSPWSVSGFSNHSHMSPRPASSLSYASAVNGTSHPFYNNDLNEDEGRNIDPIMSPGPHLHRRSVSVSDAFLDGGQADDNQGGFGWRPCMYYARGFCKNGANCKFLHGGFADSPDSGVGSPNNHLDGFDELLRIKAIQQQRLAQFGGGGPMYNRCMNLLNENPRSAAAALMMGEDYHTLGRCRPDRNDFAAMGFGGNPNSSARQIYLTFPADSTFKEEDVSNYFSTFGPVQDVRIPYQQQRMFGFVTFVFPETVKQILAKGNPHFVCDSRVLVKPYKEKGKVPDKKQQMDRGEFPACLSPTGFDSREPYDLPFGGRVAYDRQEMMLRRKLEQEAELQQVIECQGRRLMNFHIQPHLLAAGGPIPSPTHFHAQMNRSLVSSSDGINQEVLEGSNGGRDESIGPSFTADLNVPEEMNKSSTSNNGSGNNKEDSDIHGSLLEHNLPDNLFASPTKLAAGHQSFFCSASAEPDNSILVTSSSSSSNNVPVPSTTSTLNTASPKSSF